MPSRGVGVAFSPGHDSVLDECRSAEPLGRLFLQSRPVVHTASQTPVFFGVPAVGGARRVAPADER